MVARVVGLVLIAVVLALGTFSATSTAASETGETTPAPAETDETLSAFLAAGLSREEAQLVAELNQERAYAGAPALAVEPTVLELARDRSRDMASRRYFSHTTPEGRNVLEMLLDWGVDYQYAGETIQRNNYPAAQTVDEAFRSLLASPPHRAILLDGRFSHIGLGHAVDGDMHYFTVIVVEF